MQKGRWRTPKQVGNNYEKLKSSHTSVKYICLGIYSSASTPSLHKILLSTAKGESEAGLLPPCSFNSTSSMQQGFGSLGSILGLKSREWSRLKVYEATKSRQTQHVSGWKTHILVLRRCIFQGGSGRLLKLNRRLRVQTRSSWTWRRFTLLILLL